MRTLIKKYRAINPLFRKRLNKFITFDVIEKSRSSKPFFHTGRGVNSNETGQKFITSGETDGSLQGYDNQCEGPDTMGLDD
jgi:hypothetical protein